MAIWPASAGADEPPPAPIAFAGRTFEYTTAAEPHYFRPALEQLGLLGLGLAHYFTQRDANSVDWDLDYSWGSFREKLSGGAYAFDTNRFDTNYITHPAAGLLYYLSARGNRLSVLESFAYSFASSTVWEFFGEFREKVSVNDLIVTPFSGFVLGEATTQLGAFFDRSCPTTANRVLGNVFGPSKSLHDAIDGVNPRRDTICDARGLASAGSHRFELSFGSAAVAQESRESRSHGEGRMELSAEVAHLDAWGAPGHGWLAFTDGNVASLGSEIAGSAAGLTHFRIAGRTVPLGVHFRDLRGRSRFRGLGSEALLGIMAGIDYTLHSFDGPGGKLDRWFVLNAPATAFSYRFRGRRAAVELGLDAGVAFGGVDAFALEKYLARARDAELASVTRARSYSHAAGFSVVPRVLVTLTGAEIGVLARTDRLFALRFLDRSPSTFGRAPIVESRREARVWLSLGSRGFAPRFTVAGNGAYRSGQIGDVRRSAVELGVMTGVGFVL